jgi:hypothetical protein
MRLQAYRIGGDDKDGRNGASGFQHHLYSGAATGQNHVWGKRDKFCCMLSYCGFISSAPAFLDLNVAGRPSNLTARWSRVLGCPLCADSVAEVRCKLFWSVIPSL